MKRIVSFAVIIACFTLLASGAKKKNVKANENPFMAPYTAKYEIPPFEKIKLSHYMPALEAGIAQQNKEIADIVNNPTAPNFENTVLALDNSGDILAKVGGVFFALSESDATPEMQELA